MPGLKTLPNYARYTPKGSSSLCALSMLNSFPFAHLLQVLVNTGYKPKEKLNSKFFRQNRKAQLVCSPKHK